MSRLLSALVLLALAAAPQAQTVPLDRWLTGTVVPRLAEKLTQHPMFNGEIIRLSAMSAGQIDAPPTALTQRLERDLTVRLLRHDGVRIRLPGHLARPSDEPSHFVLGIEVRELSRWLHEVQIAMVDVTEGLWVSGTAYRWQGRLNRAQRELAMAGPTTASPANLLAPLSFAKVTRTGVCKGRPGSACAEISVPLESSAHLLVFSTRAGRIVPTCQASERRAAGTYRFRLPVTPSSPRGAGFYAIATRDERLAAELSQRLNTQMGACGGEQPAQDGDPLDTLTPLLANGGFEWQALHLTRRGTRLAAQ